MVLSRFLACLAIVLCVAGCSLISLKSPERPLSDRDMNTRILTREFSYHFISAVQQRADEIAASESDPGIVANTLRWKIGAAQESQRAAMRMAPAHRAGRNVIDHEETPRLEWQIRRVQYGQPPALIRVRVKLDQPATKVGR